MLAPARVVSRWCCLLALGLSGCLGPALAQPQAGPAQLLRAQRVTLDAQLRDTAFQRPLVLVSAETPQGLRGDMYALVDFPFAAVSGALQDPKKWCDVLILHLNTKYCHAVNAAQETVLNVNIGSKSPQSLSQSSRVAFAYTVATTQADYFQVHLNAPQGPLGTSDYHIALEAVAMTPNQSFLHLTYAYNANVVARLAMQGYLATLGSQKVGFTVTGESPDGQPIWIDGIRAVVERNTMRYYLAINSYLATRQQPAAKRFEASLQDWFSASERFPRQLHEVERPAYLEMKRAEYVRQQTAH